MSGFSEETLVRRLKSLAGTQDSIQTLSLWLLHHHKTDAEVIASTWLKELRKLSDPKQIINMLYLANDVIQNSRKKSPTFMKIFYSVLEPAFRHTSTHGHEPAVRAANRILSIWRDRGVYANEQIDRLAHVVSTRNSKKSSADPRLSAAGASSSSSSQRSVVAAADSSAPTVEPLSDDNNSPSSDEFRRPTGPPLKKRRSTSNIEYSVERMQDVSTKLAEALKKLRDPPSANGEIRQRIAAFPEQLANPAYLQQLASKEDANAIEAQLDVAEPVVSDYCKKLTEELETRRNCTGLLDNYLEVLRSSADKNDDMLEDARSKLQQLEDEQMTVQRALDSLPDLEETAESLEPLPSAKDLFK